MKTPTFTVIAKIKTKKEIEMAKLMTDYMNFLWDEELKRVNKRLMKMMKKFYQTERSVKIWKNQNQ